MSNSLGSSQIVSKHDCYTVIINISILYNLSKAFNLLLKKLCYMRVKVQVDSTRTTTL